MDGIREVSLGLLSVSEVKEDRRCAAVNNFGCNRCQALEYASTRVKFTLPLTSLCVDLSEGQVDGGNGVNKAICS